VESLAGLVHAGTLLIVNALLAALSSVIFTALHLSLRKTRQIRGLLLWAGSHALIAVGFSSLVLPAFGIAFPALGLFGNLLIDGGTALGLAAALVYFKQPFRLGFVLAVALSVAVIEIMYVLSHGEDLRFMVVVGGSLKAVLTIATNLLARVGGEEFMVLMVDIDALNVQAFAEELRAAVQAHTIPIEPGHDLACTISIGYHVFGVDDGWTDAVTMADRALYAAKRGGRNRVVSSGGPVDARGSD
jgi:hypothetical protein